VGFQRASKSCANNAVAKKAIAETKVMQRARKHIYKESVIGECHGKQEVATVLPFRRHAV
jgi:hypothetical protein